MYSSSSHTHFVHTHTHSLMGKFTVRRRFSAMAVGLDSGKRRRTVSWGIHRTGIHIYINVHLYLLLIKKNTIHNTLTHPTQPRCNTCNIRVRCAKPIKREFCCSIGSPHLLLYIEIIYKPLSALIAYSRGARTLHI